MWANHYIAKLGPDPPSDLAGRVRNPAVPRYPGSLGRNWWSGPARRWSDPRGLGSQPQHRSRLASEGQELTAAPGRRKRPGASCLKAGANMGCWLPAVQAGTKAQQKRQTNHVGFRAPEGMPAFLRARQKEDESSGAAVWRQLEFCQALPARGIQEILALGPSQEEVFQILEAPNGIRVALETTPLLWTEVARRLGDDDPTVKKVRSISPAGIWPWPTPPPGSGGGPGGLEGDRRGGTETRVPRELIFRALLLLAGSALLLSWASNGATSLSVLEVAHDPGGQKPRFRRPRGGRKPQQSRPPVVGGQSPGQISVRFSQEATEHPDPDPQVVHRVEGIIAGGEVVWHHLKQPHGGFRRDGARIPAGFRGYQGGHQGWIQVAGRRRLADQPLPPPHRGRERLEGVRLIRADHLRRRAPRHQFAR